MEVIPDLRFKHRSDKVVLQLKAAVRGDEVFISETYQPGSALVRFTGDSFEEVWSDRNRRRNQAMESAGVRPADIDLIIVGLQPSGPGRRRERRMVRALLPQSPCPVILVPGGCPHLEEFRAAPVGAETPREAV